MMMRKGDTATYAFYESPKRIMSVIDFFIEEGAQLRMTARPRTRSSCS